jgi:putative MATE family efflux protein
MKALISKDSRAKRDWTQGDISRNLLSLAWPTVISGTLNMIGPFIDLIWVGKLGSASVAGVGIGGTAVMVANAAISGLFTGTRVLVSRSVGAGDKDAAIHAARQSLVVGIAAAIVMALVGAFLAFPILRLFGVEKDVVHEGAVYLRILFVGMITLNLLTFNEATMQSSGDTMIPMRISVAYRVLHLVLCPLLIFGVGIFPRLGVSGAALSDVTTQGLGGILGTWILFSGRSRLKLYLKKWKIDLSVLWRMIRIGLPNSFMAIQHVLGLLFLVGFIAPFGTAAVASHTIFLRIDGVMMLLSLCLGMSAGILGAQNLGANKPERAVKSGWLAAGYSTITMVVGSIIILIWAEPIVRIFNTDPDLVKMTAAFLRIACASYAALGIGTAFRQFLTGVGDTLPAFIMEVVFTWGFLIPAAWFSNRYTDFGVWGIRWALAIRLILGGIIFALYFWWGKWKHRKV